MIPNQITSNPVQDLKHYKIKNKYLQGNYKLIKYLHNYNNNLAYLLKSTLDLPTLQALRVIVNCLDKTLHYISRNLLILLDVKLNNFITILLKQQLIIQNQWKKHVTIFFS